MKIITTALLISLAAIPLAAQSETRVLLPVFISQTDGVGGSVFETRLALHNFSSTFTTVGGLYGNCQLSGRQGPGTEACPEVAEIEVAPGETAGGFQAFSFSGNPGYILVIDRQSLEVGLRAVIDFNPLACSSGMGTEIPVVPEDQFFNTTFSLLDIPSESGYRLALRVYSFQDTSVIVRVFDSSGTQVSEQTLAVAGSFTPYIPAIGQSFDSVGGGSGGPMRIEIVPTGAPVWAFASLTDNISQQITLVTPRHR